MIEMECLICEAKIKTADVQDALAFDRRHKEKHAEVKPA